MNEFVAKPGKVYLVGAGPGDPGLITVRATQCLALAELVLYDYLVNPVLLDYAPPQAERVCLGHPHGGRGMHQDEINARMLEASRGGRTVVRLKSGDPCLFGRGAEEADVLRAAGIQYEIVPGVTAAFGASSHAEIPLTHRDAASAVALITGHRRGDGAGPELDYSSLAAFPGTLVFYMGMTSAPQWSQALVDGGRSPQTPVAIVRRVTWPDQEVLRCDLGGLAAFIQERRIRPPAVIVVGEVVARRPAESESSSGNES